MWSHQSWYAVICLPYESFVCLSFCSRATNSCRFLCNSACNIRIEYCSRSTTVDGNGRTAGSSPTTSPEPGAKRNGVRGKGGTGGVKTTNCGSPLGKRRRLCASGEDGVPQGRGIDLGVHGDVKSMSRVQVRNGAAFYRYVLETEVHALQSLSQPSEHRLLTSGRKKLVESDRRQKKKYEKKFRSCSN